MMHAQSCGGHFEDRFDRDSLTLVLDGAIDLSEWVKVHELVERKPTLRVQVA
jgi:hypothetical protein